MAIAGTSNVDRIEAPVTFKGYLICAFAACKCALSNSS